MTLTKIRQLLASADYINRGSIGIVFAATTNANVDFKTISNIILSLLDKDD